MKIFTQIYDDLKLKISNENLVKHFDVWNNQLDAPEHETIITPALFFEIAEMNFIEHQQALQSNATIRIHIVQHQFSRTQLSLLDNILNSIANAKGELYTSLIPVAYLPDYNHDMIRHDIIEFSTNIWHQYPEEPTVSINPLFNVNTTLEL